jgi:glycosyltransferase involved in cell wall biosynthesis
VAGDGNITETRAEVSAKGLADRVSVPGWVGPEQVVELTSRADVLVLPSREENLPMSVIEGMAAGLAVVTTPVGAVPEIMTDGENGLLVPPGDPVRLASALERVIRDSDLRQRLGSAAKAFHSKELAIVPYWPRLVAIWRSAIAESNVEPRRH